jgi:hypothetical protein
MTAWTDFVKEYAAKNNVSYKTALSQASESYKNRGTTQVKRNVAQRGLADIAREAKKVMMKPDEATVQVNRNVAQQSLADIAGQAKEEFKAYRDREFKKIRRRYNYYMELLASIDLLPTKSIRPKKGEYGMSGREGVKKFVIGKEMTKTINTFKKAVEKLGTIPTMKDEPYPFATTISGDIVMLHNTSIHPLKRKFVDNYTVYEWQPNAKEWFDKLTKEALDYYDDIDKGIPEKKEIAEDPRLERKYFKEYDQYYWVLKKPDRFGFTPFWDYYYKLNRHDGKVPIAVRYKNHDFFARYNHYPTEASKKFYIDIENRVKREGLSMKEVLDKFFG